MKYVNLFLFLLLFLLPIKNISYAQNKQGFFNKLLAPGPLLKGHRNLEQSGCLNCHAVGEGVPNSKCLNCHKEIKNKVQMKKGFHGNLNKKCIACHLDHKGENFDSTKFNLKTFKHDKTGFELRGEHFKLKCSKCHTEKRGNKVVRSSDIKFLGQTSTCVACHKKDDPHLYKNKFKKMDCNKCHSEVKWKKDVTFNHLKDANYDLEGKHKKISCAKCHIVNKKEKKSKYFWKNLKTNKCLSCHKDIHKNNIQKRFGGGNCKLCHNQNKWKIDRFNHDVTKYKLQGKHKKITCIKCHAQSKKNLTTKSHKNYFWKQNIKKTTCIACHGDKHKFNSYKSKKFKNPKNCKSCHNQNSWKETKFNHNTQTRYSIDGAHKKLNCTSCHFQKNKKKQFISSRYQWPSLMKNTCVACHKSPHLKTFSKKIQKQKCATCHVTTSWKQIRDKKNRRFNHDITRFKLTGEHKNLTCNKCHVQKKKQVFKFKSVSKNFCVDCHTNIHKKQFSKKIQKISCLKCHDTSSFKKVVKFNHDITGYKLRGKHRKTSCKKCHIINSKIHSKESKKYNILKRYFKFPKLKSKKCSMCHYDFHNKQLGNSCFKCHNQTNWKKNFFKHNTMSSFKLKGAHKKVKCIKCHKETNNKFRYDKKIYNRVHFKPIAQSCTTCHKDKHKGNFGSKCLSCHNVDSWKNAKKFHTSNYKLRGFHNQLQCIQCHKDKPLTNLSNDCLSCHRKDDVHLNQLPNCSSCHTQSMWPAVTFKHTQTSFPLRGIHKTLSCKTCHARGYFTNKGTSCADCHWQLTSKAKIVKHVQPNFNDCSGCHSQFTFQGLK